MDADPGAPSPKVRAVRTTLVYGAVGAPLLGIFIGIMNGWRAGLAIGAFALVVWAVQGVVLYQLQRRGAAVPPWISDMVQCAAFGVLMGALFAVGPTRAGPAAIGGLVAGVLFFGWRTLLQRSLMRRATDDDR
jgi:hypothetical protein